MAPLRRRKRDTAENIYRHCKPWGTCPPDVINKVEGTTIADRILQYGSGLTYFGGLGIGTGTGAGGRLGYLPLGNRPAGRPAIPFGPVKPPVGPAETIPAIVDAGIVDATADSIVPLIDDVGGLPVEVDSGASDLGPTVTSGPTVPGSTDVSLVPPTRDVTVSESTHRNPVFEDSFDMSQGVVTSRAVSIDHTVPTGTFVGATTGTAEGAEAIELHSFVGQFEGDAEGRFNETVVDSSGLQSSTPKTGVQSTNRFKGPKVSVYNRRYQQVQVQNKVFLSHPEDLVVHGGDVRPVDTSLDFDVDLEDLVPAPESDFQSLRYLSRPYYSQGREGRVRVSRIGQESSVQTRSGLVFGPQKHYFTDVSSITSPPSDLGVSSSSDTIVGVHSTIAGGEEIELQSLYSESELLDAPENVGEDLQLVLGGTRRRPPPTLPIPRASWPGPIGEVIVDFGGPSIAGDSVPPTDSPVSPPWVVDGDGGSGYWIDPSLLTNKKRKKHFH
ncbi:L2 protein [Rupicapra rupicapra papillomavirus 1]|uniref:Minor capsid protein L2 n=1 Tax=Rupicapra rupicapra papillomavirus 1 TaxID=1163708 RepID=X2DBW4_9PAPI|nr:L2 protein [Rupicapra rupicapra papillomavirus 1]AHL46428.1 L2 protein [Rupicapra rupicapra papillomavirus 1]